MFKINISHKGKTIKFEIENEDLAGTKIGEKISGKDVDDSLDGYELEIMGTSDKAGFPGLQRLDGPGLRRELLTYGIGMKKKPKGEKKKSSKPKGLRLRKTVRGNEISLDTVQINTKVLKEGSRKFEDLLPKKEEENPKENEQTSVEEIKTEEKPKEAKPAEENSAKKTS